MRTVCLFTGKNQHVVDYFNLQNLYQLLFTSNHYLLCKKYLPVANGIWGRSPLLLMSLVEELCVMLELTVWSCLQSDWLPPAAELFRLALPTPGTLFLNTPSQLLRCSHLSVI